MSLHFDKLNAEFKRALSETIREMKDPRISNIVSIMGVEITNDLRHAKVHVSIYDDEKTCLQTIEVLNNASKMIAHAMNERMIMRRIPAMRFVLDDSIEYSVHIGKLIDEINASSKPDERDDNNG